VFTGLTATARETPGVSLDEWWSAQRCAAAWGDAIRPAGYGVYVEGEIRLPFLLEYDTGSETLARLEDKLPGYAALNRAVDHPTWVCFCFPTAAREAAARRVLVHPEVPVATAVISPDSAPGGPVWLAIGDAGPRLRWSTWATRAAPSASSPRGLATETEGAQPMARSSAYISCP
jgi:hypothetical protein